MKSIVIYQETKEDMPYPILVQHKEFKYIVMLKRDDSGMVINSSEMGNIPLGYTSDSWDRRQFDIFTGKITLDGDYR